MDAFAFRQPQRAERALKAVLTWMARSRLAPMVRVARTVLKTTFRRGHQRHHQRHHERDRRGPQLTHPVDQETGRRVSEPGAVPQGYLLPSRRPGLVPG